MMINKQKIQRFLIIFTIAFCLLSQTTAVFAKKNVEQVPDQLLLQLDPLSGATIDDIHASYGTSTVRQLMADQTFYLVALPADNKLADRIALDPRLLLVEPNYIGQIPEAVGSAAWAWGGQDDAPYQEQYAADLLNLRPAHALSQGAGTTVAILDTGIQLDHPALANSLVAGYDFVDGDNQPNDEWSGNPSDHNVGGHGTHVAGIVHFVAPAAKLLPVRVLAQNGRGDAFMLAEAVLYAAEAGADVINLSLGMPKKSETLRAAIRYVSQQGVIVVAAAGNLGKKEKQHPAATPCVLGVTAVNANSVKADFANFGSWVDFAAPGEAIYSTFPDGSYAWWSGTSMAAPFVAGQAALLHSMNNELSLRETAVIIANTSQPLANANPNLASDLGNGLPNIAASLQLLQSGTIPDGNQGLANGSCLGTSSD